ncbi:hypothetical protein GQ55_9G053800 [Panicum hallii var. hallii]|uniref:Uncharacterized protein n=1 Tax=Panicum hallii var. hallii TaxID=1504633 RepID=A0A2T7BZV6_9POAL|nr:hypothetical protein GQ55_9G053800 [Panicum hallii var. hallii]
MSAEYNGSSEMSVGQPKAVGRKQLRRGTKRRFVMTHDNQEGTNGGNMVPFSAALRDEENVGEVIHCPSVTINVGEIAISEAAYGSKVPIGNPAGDFCWPVVATNDDEENIGKVAYDSILNLESPDPTTLLRIMMGNKYSTDEVSAQFQNVARLQAPEFTTLLTIMNNAGYGETTDDGHYDVYKVMTNLEGW